jgi:hypothetical protein
MRASDLLPKEHGAYVMLLVPAAAALGMGVSAAGLLFALGGLLLFFANEPLSILAGLRGGRRREDLGRAAWGALGLLGASAAAAILAGVLLAPRAAQALLLLPLGLGGAAVGLALSGRARSSLGELGAGIALCAWAAPITAAGGEPPLRAVGSAAVIGLTFCAAVIAIRALIRGNKPYADRRQVAVRGELAITLCFVAAAGIGAATRLWLVGLLVPLPVIAVSAAFCAFLPSPRKLRRLGWAMAAASASVPVLLAVFAR